MDILDHGLDAANLSWEPLPPGQERACPVPSKTGLIPFRIPSTGETCSTFYSLWGSLSSGKTPLICLHGGPGIVHDYLLPISLLSIDYDIPVVMYDQVGCGRSTRFRDGRDRVAFYTPALFMAELENVIRSLGVAAYDLFGHSVRKSSAISPQNNKALADGARRAQWGGMLAAQFAVSQPRGLRKLIISNSPSGMYVPGKYLNQGNEKLTRRGRYVDVVAGNNLSPLPTTPGRGQGI